MTSFLRGAPPPKKNPESAPDQVPGPGFHRILTRDWSKKMRGGEGGPRHLDREEVNHQFLSPEEGVGRSEFSGIKGLL